jgi:histone H3/H4
VAIKKQSDTEDDEGSHLDFNLDHEALQVCDGIKKSKIQQIAKDASRSNVQTKTYKTAKAALYIFLKHLLRQSFIVSSNRKTKTLATDDVLYVLGENQDQEKCLQLGTIAL